MNNSVWCFFHVLDGIFTLTIVPELRLAGGVNHSDSDLVETGESSAKKALR